MSGGTTFPSPTHSLPLAGPRQETGATELLDHQGAEIAPSSGGGGLAAVLAASNTTGEQIIVMPLGTINATTANGEFDEIAGPGIGWDAYGGDDNAGSGNGGTAAIHGGFGNNGVVDGATIQAQGGAADGTGGSATIQTGNGHTGSGKQGGDITLNPGLGDGAGRQGLVILLQLPTSDPHIVGALWANSHVLTVSAG